jgi:TRAP transporter TAXI family solute receptor
MPQADPPEKSRRPRKLRDVSTHDLLLALGPAAVLIALAFWLAFRFVQPAPPRHLTIVTGSEIGAYYGFAQRYQEILARDGVRLEIRTSPGSLENLALLMNPDSGVEVGFAQGGSGSAANSPRIFSLGSIYYEPVWIFLRKDLKIQDIADLRGKRIAVGPDGSGTRALALQILSVNDLPLPPTTLLYLGTRDAADGLKNGSVDAAFIVSAPEATILQELLEMPGVALLSLDNAAAYVLRFPFLTRLTLPRSTVDFVSNIPPQNVSLVAPTTNIVCTDDLHPALAYLLLSAMKEVHGGAGWFQTQGEFPAPIDVDFPLSDQAERFYKSGVPFLYKYLPFWLANLVERLWVLVVPLVAIVIPLMKLVPPLYAWRIRSRVYRWYGELKFLEQEVTARPNLDQIPELLRRLDHIDRAVGQTNVPLAYANQLYTLKEHIRLVRREIRELRMAAAESRSSGTNIPPHDA